MFAFQFQDFVDNLDDIYFSFNWYVQIGLIFDKNSFGSVYISKIKP